jgi:hypothetical protein
MTAIATQPDAAEYDRAGAIPHGEVESELRGIRVRRIVSLWGRMVHRLDEWHYSIDGGEQLLLLRAIDELMKRRRPLAFDMPAGQDNASASSV